MRRCLILFITLISLNVPALACESRPASSSNSTCNVTIVDFWAECASGTTPFSTNFISNVQGPVTKWKWTFEPTDDDYYSQHPNTARHTFHEPGNYTVTLQVWDSHGRMYKLIKENYIQVSSREHKCSPSTKSHAPDHHRSDLTEHISDNKIKSVLWEFKGCHVKSTVTYNNGTIISYKIATPML